MIRTAASWSRQISPVGWGFSGGADSSGLSEPASRAYAWVGDESGVKAPCARRGIVGHALDVGLVGRDGVAGTAVFPGISWMPCDGVVQIAGRSYRINAEVLRGELLADETLYSAMGRFAQVLHVRCMAMSSQNTAASVRSRADSPGIPAAPAPGDVIVCREGSSRGGQYSLREHPAQPQVLCGSRESALEIARSFALARGVTVWDDIDGCVMRLPTPGAQRSRLAEPS